jgi:hypothetical protein
MLGYLCLFVGGLFDSAQAGDEGLGGAVQAKDFERADQYV